MVDVNVVFEAHPQATVSRRKISLFEIPTKGKKLSLSNDEQATLSIIHCDEPYYSLQGKFGNRTMEEEPSYQLRPSCLVDIAKVREILKSTCDVILGKFFSNIDVSPAFDQTTIRSMILQTVEKAKENMKCLDLKRYRVITSAAYSDHVRYPGSYINGFLWDAKYDTYEQIVYNLKKGCLICVVYFVYKE